MQTPSQTSQLQFAKTFLAGALLTIAGCQTAQFKAAKDANIPTNQPPIVASKDLEMPEVLPPVVERPTIEATTGADEGGPSDTMVQTVGYQDINWEKDSATTPIPAIVERKTIDIDSQLPPIYQSKQAVTLEPQVTLEPPVNSESGQDEKIVTTPDGTPVEQFDWKQPLRLTLEQAIQQGLQNSKVFRDLGGTVLRNPNSLSSSFDAAITQSDPNFGEAAALSEFDTRFSSRIFFENNDREVNNQFLGTNGVVQQDLGNIQFDLTKRTATGGQFALRSVSDYDNNNSVGNRFGNPSSSWQTYLEGEVRQPLFRGGRVDVARIAGPGAATGEYNGILIARTRTDATVSEFKIGVRNLISDIENAYWDLYFAYRDLEAKKLARDNALSSWRRIKALGNERKVGGEADKEGQAREQYFRFEAAVQDAMYGSPGQRTRTNNGSTPGTFQFNGGVRVAERNLKLMMGLPIDETSILPIDEPQVAPVQFDPTSCTDIAFTNRSELKRQNVRIRQLELQYAAARNTLLPQLDVVGRYRFRGFGKDLIGDTSLNSTAFDDLSSGDHQEWQVGVELNVPIGFRRENAAVRNIQQRMLREKIVLDEQKRQISADVGNAIDNVKRAYQIHLLQYNRLNGALDQLRAVTITNKQKKAPLNLVLEAQRRVLEAQTELYRAKVQYAIALRNVSFEKGTLLNDLNVMFTDQMEQNSTEFVSMITNEVPQ